MSIVQGGMDQEESKALFRFLDGATVQNHEGKRMVDMHCNRLLSCPYIYGYTFHI